MAPKRKTLDSIGTRLRARTYADSYVPKPIDNALVSDAVVRRSVPAISSVSHDEAEILAVQKAKSMLSTAGVVNVSSTVGSVAPPATVNNVVRPHYAKPSIPVNPQKLAKPMVEPAISDIVRQIQRVEEQKTDIRPISYENISGLKSRLSHIVQSMFASRRSIAMTSMSFLLFVGGTVALISSFTTNKAVSTQVKALSDKVDASTDVVNESLGATDSSGAVPSEEKVPEAVINSYRPPADEPRYIYIPKIKNSKTRVLKMGVGKDGAVQTPRTTWDTGWFEDSSKPGDKVGAGLIVGHVSGLTGGGVFYNLYRMTEGDEIIVETGDGTKYTYKVVSKEEVPADSINMNNYLVSKDIDKPGLTIMTCAGEFNPTTQTFDNRLAVFAVRTD